MEECINDLFESGFTNDKLPLTGKSKCRNCSQNVNRTVKQKVIQNTIMQGTVWGSLCCTVSMDKLGKHIYKKHELLYRYKGVVDVPSLGMVDDKPAVQKCSKDTVRINAVINAFVESKKLN